MLVYRQLDVNNEYQIVIRWINELKEELNFTQTDRMYYTLNFILRVTINKFLFCYLHIDNKFLFNSV